MVELLDTTLREGEQTPGVTFQVEEKLAIASYLDDFGVDFIEAGHPRVSNDVFLAVKTIAQQGYRAKILAHCRALSEDIDAAMQCEVSWVGIFFCVSNRRITQQFQMTLSQVIDRITQAIHYAKDHGLHVRYTLEDASRTDYKSLLTVAHAVEEAGADRISIADTVGAMTPHRMYTLIRQLRRELSVDLHVHCHNDLGLATANALAAYEAGVHTIDVTVNGLGERVGITPLSEICLTIHRMYQEQSKWKLELLPQLSQIVAAYSGVPLPPNSPIVGQNAFTHNAGLHVTAVTHDPSFYEVFPPELIGAERNIILDKMASKDTIRQKLNQMGMTDDQYNLIRVMNYVKSKEKGSISDEELKYLMTTIESQQFMFQ